MNSGASESNANNVQFQRGLVAGDRRRRKIYKYNTIYSKIKQKLWHKKRIRASRQSRNDIENATHFVHLTQIEKVLHTANGKKVHFSTFLFIVGSRPIDFLFIHIRVIIKEGRKGTSTKVPSNHSDREETG